MAYRLSDKTEEVIYKTKRLIEGVQCDNCKKFIPAQNWKVPASKYFKVITGHHDWGNDSF